VLRGHQQRGKQMAMTLTRCTDLRVGKLRNLLPRGSHHVYVCRILGHRRAIIKNAIEALRRRARLWRMPTGTTRVRVISRGRMLLSALCGPLIFYRSLMQDEEIRMPERTTLAQKIVRYTRKAVAGAVMARH
jgi:hypothetical protein